jgi:hypothetical protein
MKMFYEKIKYQKYLVYHVPEIIVNENFIFTILNIKLINVSSAMLICLVYSGSRTTIFIVNYL